MAHLESAFPELRYLPGAHRAYFGRAPGGSAALHCASVVRSKPTRVNPDLATIIGINANTVYLICFGIGTFFAGVAAFWYGVQFTVEPTMGQRPVIFAFVVAFLAGTASGPVRVFFTGIVVALLEQWSSMFIPTRWTQTAVFVILFGYLVSKSLQGKNLFGWLKLARA